MADTTFIEDRKDDLAGLVLTHAHEDHIGAVPHIWPRLRCPIYATPFTAQVLRGKLEEAGLLHEAEITEVSMSGRFRGRPLRDRAGHLTHSIPEPNALVIRTDAGTVLHTGDWKLDPEPMLGETYDEAALRALADENDPGHGLRFHQRLERRRFRVRGRCLRQPARSWSPGWRTASS